MALTTLPLISLFAAQTALTLREKLCATLRQLINSGKVQKGDRLPSSRLLACDLSISRVTVEAAYSQLESEGYLYRLTGRGTYVAIVLPAGRAEKKAPGDAKISLSARGRSIIATGGCTDPLFPQAFAAGSPDLRAFPHSLWRRITAQTLRQNGESLMRYGCPQGLPALREAVANYLALSRGVRCDPGQVIIVTSSQQALQMLAVLLCDPGDSVGMEDPGYPGARNAFISTGADMRSLPLDNDGAVLPENTRMKLAYLTPSHQYPTGITMSLHRRLQWLAWAREHNCWLIEDDYDSEFYYDAPPVPSLQGLDNDGRVLYLGTFSKVMFPSLRLAYLVVPSSLVDPLCRLRSLMDGHSAQLMQAITAEFIHNGHLQAHLRLMRRLYASRRNLLLDEIQHKLGDKLQIMSRGNGLQLAVTLTGGEEEKLSQQARADGLLLPRLSPLYASASPPQGWLLGFSALTRAEIIHAVDKLARLRY
ncbi:PLP-dependent aminotransferase family protein [Erwinia sp. ErVv1]|uniref:MocR-like pyridoxine biosynthesis transcription factor PdxR n=1 Tax=Erwinia sp. ErVv1 TaxID=1603299 RepID=UPI00082AB913|nr:PLP-dependent aminotransferase family protein [Erwinia sp. ErVv1]